MATDRYSRPFGRLEQRVANDARFLLTTITFLGEQQAIFNPEAAVLVAWPYRTPMFCLPATIRDLSSHSHRLTRLVSFLSRRLRTTFGFVTRRRMAWTPSYRSTESLAVRVLGAGGWLSGGVSFSSGDLLVVQLARNPSCSWAWLSAAAV